MTDEQERCTCTIKRKQTHLPNGEPLDPPRCRMCWKPIKPPAKEDSTPCFMN